MLQKARPQAELCRDSIHRMWDHLHPNEVAALKREVGALVGEDKLSFDLINGRMSVAGNPAATVASIEKAVARTGMHAELWVAGGETEGALAEDRRRQTQDWRLSKLWSD